jgi:hypothetical protein
MSESKKMDILNDMFTTAENAKIEFGERCREIQAILQQAKDTIKETSAEGLTEVFKNLKTFLESANGTMKSIETELREVAGDCSMIQTTLASK